MSGLRNYDEEISREPEVRPCRSCGCESGRPGCVGTSVTCTNPYCPCSEPVLLKHGAEPLYQNADYCGHPEPPEPDSADDTGWSAWDEWHGDHPNSSGFNGEPICLLTPAGTYCPACTEAEREERDLPLDEYMDCLLGTKEASDAG